MRPLRTLLPALFLLAGCGLNPFHDDDDSPAGDDDDTSGGDDDTSGGDDDDVGDDDTGTGDDDTGTGDDDDDTTPPDPVEGLNCLPIQQTLATIYGAPVTTQLSAIVLDDQGNTVAAPDPNWSVLGDFGGSVDATGLYTTPSTHGGTGYVQVESHGSLANCQIDITMTGDINQSGNSSLPAVAASTPVTANASCAATVVYPLDDSVMAGAMVPPLIQWDAAPGANMYVLTLSSDWTSLNFYLSATSLQPTVDQWAALTEFDPGTVVAIDLAAGNWNGSSFTNGLCTPAAPTTVTVSDFGIAGTVFYWAPAAFQGGIRRIDIGSTTSVAVTMGGSAVSCVGCHGANLGYPSRLAVVDLGFWPTVYHYDVGTGSPAQVSSSASALYSAPNNNGTRAVVDDMIAGFNLVNQTTGASLGAVPVEGQPAFPNWSPLGNFIVYSSCGSANGSSGASQMSASLCDLRLLEVLPNDQWGSDTLLVQHSGQETLYYPAFSPDGQWVAYNRVPSGDSYDNPLAELWIVAATPGSTPIRLDAANRAGLTNSWPRWSPASGDYDYIAFSSKQDYGNVVTGGGPAQVWVAGIDLPTAALGQDPSFPPVWLPGQSTTAGNHTPTWVPRYTP